MPVAYSTDLRTRVIDAWNAKEGTQAQLAERFTPEFEFCQTGAAIRQVSPQAKGVGRGVRRGVHRTTGN